MAVAEGAVAEGAGVEELAPAVETVELRFAWLFVVVTEGAGVEELVAVVELGFTR